jgi:phage baseplate assembly protein W
MTSPVNLRFPYQLDGRGRTAEDGEEAYVRGLVEQVLFTSPGERVNRPDFGSGLLQLVFAPNSVELAATTQLLVQGALQQWLGDLIVVETVEVEADDAALRVTVGYVIRRTDARQLQAFAIAVPGAGGGS